MWLFVSRLQEVCASLQAASYLNAVDTLTKKLPEMPKMAVDGLTLSALSGVLRGQADCPKQLQLTAYAEFQLCLASVWRDHGVNPAPWQHSECISTFRRLSKARFIA